jgi:hypothetical protein
VIFTVHRLIALGDGCAVEDVCSRIVPASRSITSVGRLCRKHRLVETSSRRATLFDSIMSCVENMLRGDVVSSTKSFSSANVFRREGHADKNMLRTKTTCRHG